jgi:hypothetical protein
LHHLLQHGGAALGLSRAHHQIVGQQHGKGLIAHQTFGAQHRMPETERARLAHIHAVHIVGLDGVHHLQ